MRFALTPAQSRAGRALLDWTQKDLADAALVGLSTVRGFELGTRAPTKNNQRAMRQALEQAGVEFIENGATTDKPGGVGARLREVFPV